MLDVFNGNDTFNGFSGVDTLKGSMATTFFLKGRGRRARRRRRFNPAWYVNSAISLTADLSAIPQTIQARRPVIPIHRSMACGEAFAR